MKKSPIIHFSYVNIKLSLALLICCLIVSTNKHVFAETTLLPFNPPTKTSPPSPQQNIPTPGAVPSVESPTPSQSAPPNLNNPRDLTGLKPANNKVRKVEIDQSEDSDKNKELEVTKTPSSQQSRRIVSNVSDMGDTPSKSQKKRTKPLGKKDAKDIVKKETYKKAGAENESEDIDSLLTDSKNEEKITSEELINVVIPEVMTPIEMSNSDINRITCMTGIIKEVIYSKEKGLSIKYSGKDAFLKFLIRRTPEGKEIYSSTPAEIYITCDESTYSLIAFPKRRVPQTVRLVAGAKDKIKKNNEMFAGVPYEKKILLFVKTILAGQTPESFGVKKVNKKIDMFRDVKVTWKYIISAEGEGMQIKEYWLELRDNVQSIEFDEKEFMRTEFATRPVAISIDKPKIKKGEIARVIVVEMLPDVARHEADE